MTAGGTKNHKEGDQVGEERSDGDGLEGRKERGRLAAMEKRWERGTGDYVDQEEKEGGRLAVMGKR